MDQNVSIDEVLNNSFATIYDVLKIVDSNVNDLVINNLNNNATADEILRLKQFNEDYIKVMQETKCLQNDIVGLFNYMNKDISAIKQDEQVIENEVVQQDVNQMTEGMVQEAQPEMVNDFGQAPEVVGNVVETPADMINPEAVSSDGMVEENQEEVNEDNAIENNEEVASDETIDNNQDEVVSEEVTDQNNEEEVTDEVVEDNSEEITDENNGEVATEEVVEDNQEAVVSEENTDENTGEVIVEDNPSENSEEVVATEEVSDNTGVVVAEGPVDAPVENTNATSPEITFNGPEEASAHEDVVIPIVNSEVSAVPEAPVAEGETTAVVQEDASVSIPTVAETPAQEEPTNTELKVFRTTNDPAKVILVTNPQYDKLKQSLETNKALLNAKGMFASDGNLEEQLVQNGLLEGSVEDKQQQIQQLIAEAQELYKEGKNEEAQQKMNLVSQLNEQIKSAAPQESVMAA